MKVITHPQCTDYFRRGHPERPQRVSLTVEHLRAQSDLAIEWTAPGEVTPEQVLRVHSAQHVKDLTDPFTDFDADTPAYPHIVDHARRSAAGALSALEEARQGRKAFSLLRPPGHHALRERAMGFCYLNSLAIAVREALASGMGKVAVFDFDVHHGNGVEALVLNVADCSFYSVHQYPAFPGTGVQSMANCHNYPVPPHSERPVYMDELRRAFDDLLEFKPDLIAVSAGFDAYRGDPLSDEPLETEDFGTVGEWIGQCGVPAFCILEGGYSKDLPELILAFLTGWEGRKPSKE